MMRSNPHRRARSAASTGLLGVAIATAAVTLPDAVQAQQRGASPFGSAAAGITQSYVGLSIGRTKFDPDCAPGLGCEDGNRGFKITAGAISADVFGAEVSYLDLGKANASGGSQKASGLNMSGLATLPLTDALAGFAKLGLTLGQTSVSSSVPTVSTGTKRSLGLSYGIGLSFALTPQLTAIAELEQYRFRFTNGNQTLGFTSVGLRYRF